MLQRPCPPADATSATSPRASPSAAAARSSGCVGGAGSVPRARTKGKNSVASMGDAQDHPPPMTTPTRTKTKKTAAAATTPASTRSSPRSPCGPSPRAGTRSRYQTRRPHSDSIGRGLTSLRAGSQLPVGRPRSGTTPPQSRVRPWWPHETSGVTRTSPRT